MLGTPAFGEFPCQVCELKSAIYNVTEKGTLQRGCHMSLLEPKWLHEGQRYESV